MYDPQGTTQTILVPCHPHQISTLNDDDSRKPSSREKITLPSEEEAVTKRERRGYSDYRHVQTVALKAFFRCFCIQFNNLFLCECIGTKYRNYNANEADEETELQTPLEDALRNCRQ